MARIKQQNVQGRSNAAQRVADAKSRLASDSEKMNKKEAEWKAKRKAAQDARDEAEAEKERKQVMKDEIRQELEQEREEKRKAQKRKKDGLPEMGVLRDSDSRWYMREEV